MSLYDDEEVGLSELGEAPGWSRGLARAPPPPSTPQPPPALKIAAKPSSGAAKRSSSSVLAPVVNLQSNRVASSNSKAPSLYPTEKQINRGGDRSSIPLTDPNWQPVNEYDPLWPNDYVKVSSEIRDTKRASVEESAETKKRRYAENSREKARERFNQANSPGSGFSRRRHSDEEDDDDRRSSNGRRRRDHRRSTSGSSTPGGAAIAPPPSLTETSHPPPTQDFPIPSSGGGSLAGLGVAAKIMAKYGYKQGQGLGRDEQGMSVALSVEKTSKRGGRIVHEKDLVAQGSQVEDSPPSNSNNSGDEYGNGKPSITDIMKNPSKVVLCKNMVGPGEVDEFLEPEVKEECNTKYGDVCNVVIYEVPNVNLEEDAVRIFIEFKRVESAIKAVVDLNGRFFGGREVQANFYDLDKFNNFKLGD